MPEHEQATPAQQAVPAATAGRPGRGAPSLQAFVLGLQGSAGNAAAARVVAAGMLRPRPLARQSAPTQAPTQTPAPQPATTPARHAERGMRDSPDVELLQLKLNWHLGFLGHTLLRVDGWFGGQTARALRQVKRAYTHRPYDDKVDAGVWQMLDSPPSRSRTETGAGPNYGEMMQDGLLDITMAVGFDERDIQIPEAAQVRRGLTEVRGFRRDDQGAARIRSRARGSGMGTPGPDLPAGTEEWYVKEAVAMQDNLVVHCVVRLVVAPAGEGVSGAGAREAVLRGMNESDAFMYAGHGRYGTGMDFDYKYEVEIDWSRHPNPPAGRTGVERFPHADDVVRLLRLGNNDAMRIRRFRELRDQGIVRVVGRAEGNIRINERASAEGDATFSGWLMSEAVQGSERPLPTRIQERRHRVWLFNGCTTRHYDTALRAAAPSNGNLAPGRLGVIGTLAPSMGTVRSESLLTYLDGLLARETAAALQARLSSAQAAADATVGYMASGF